MWTGTSLLQCPPTPTLLEKQSDLEEHAVWADTVGFSFLEYWEERNMEKMCITFFWFHNVEMFFKSG